MADAGQFQTAEEVYLTDRDAERKMYAQIMKKLQEARVEFAETGVAANGRNNFNNFDYIQLKDILKIAIPLLARHGLATHHRLHECPPLIDVVDTESGYSISFGTNYREGVDGKNTNQKLQSLGGSETYIRRYIYMQILDIYEADPDQNFGKDEVTKQSRITKKISKPKAKPSNDKRLSPSDPSRYKREETDDGETQRLGHMIRDEITARNIMNTRDNQLMIAREWWQNNKITPQQYRQLKDAINGGKK